MKQAEAIESATERLARPGANPAATPPANLPPLRVLLATGCVPSHLKVLLAAHLKSKHDGRDVAIETGVVGDLGGNLDRLRTTPAEAAVVLIEWCDLDPRLGLSRLGGWQPDAFGDIIQTARTQAGRIGESLERLADTKPAAVCLPTLPLPPIDLPPRARAGTLELELRGIVAWLAASVARRPHIRVVRTHLLDARSPVDQRLDVRSALHAGFPYTIEHASAVADQLAELIRNRPPKRGLITDLDGTLWKGAVSEDGVAGVHWDLDHGAQMHGLYQQLLASLAGTGVLLAAVGTSSQAAVEKVWQRGGLLLPRGDVSAVETSRAPKSESVRRILNAWNVSPESVVLVDDCPLDVAAVRQAHPGLECLHFPVDDEQEIWALLHRLRDIFGASDPRSADRAHPKGARAEAAARTAS